ncbi:primase-helicase zinc-binding domain-containing protein [Thiothrix subterranea]|nr:primase-helicase zinc-binding domain-containing protein [Thiothrix subterranea]
MTAKNQQFSFSELQLLMRGKWAGYHGSVGIIQHKIGKQVGCQGCGGEDRFSFQKDYPETGRWFCRQGGDPTGGDGFALLHHIYGWTPQQQLQSVADYLGLSKIDDKEKKALRLTAEKQAKELQAAIAKKDEQARRDSNVLTMLENLIDEIRHRQYLQHQAVRFNGGYIAEPTIDEVTTAQELNAAILEAYAHKRGVDYV